MRVFITGGAGYIASHAALRLLDEGHSVAIIDNLFRGNRGAIAVLERLGGARVSFLEADILDIDAVTRFMRDAEPELVLHFAGLTYVGESVERPADYLRVNTEGGIALLEAMHRASVGRIIFSSTAATYGEPAAAHIPIREDTPQLPVNPYGLSKLLFENELRTAVEKTQPTAATTTAAAPLAAIALRYFNVAGSDALGRLGEDHRPETHLVPLALEVALGKRAHISIFGTDYDTHDGTCVRDYVHVDDLISAHLAAIPALAPGRFQYWNVGIGRGYSVKEVIESCRRVTGHAIPTINAERRAGDPSQLYAEGRAITRDLGWQPKWVELDAIVATAWRWMKAHPGGYE